MSFDDFLSKRGYMRGYKHDYQIAFDYGAQSQQVKIDELKNKYDAMYNAFIVADDCRKEWYESYMSARKERDELQAGIDEAVAYIAESGGVNLTSEIALNHILKGNEDD